MMKKRGGDRVNPEPEGSQVTSITITKAARRAGVDVYVVRHCVEIGLMEEELTERDLAELRRVRRLMTLGINMPGVEVILRMRRRIQDLQAEVARLESLVRSWAPRKKTE
jgi:DNA-binding transcriptional MerR regulator